VLLFEHDAELILEELDAVKVFRELLRHMLNFEPERLKLTVVDEMTVLRGFEVNVEVVKILTH